MAGVFRDLSGRPSRHPERIGPYRVRGVLGRGGMGVVFDAEGPGGEPVALKIVRHADDAARLEATRARFEREARILGGLNHPSVVRLIDAGEADGLLYLAMERIDGVSLLAVRRRGPVEIEPLVSIGFQLADALAHVHDAGVVHRDIKPANVLVRPDGRPVITDFGISGLSHATGITRHGDLLGSPGFMAPEIVNGHHPSPASDQFALGRLLFELGARGPAPKLPQGVPLLEVLRRALDIDWTRFPAEDRWPDLARILDRMVEPEPEDRYASAALARSALASVLDDALAPETVSAHVEGLELHTESAWTIESSPNDILSDLDLPAGMSGSERERLAEAASAPPPELPAELLGPAEPEDARTVLEAAAAAEVVEAAGQADTRLSKTAPTEVPPAPPSPPSPPSSAGRPRLKLPSLGSAARAEVSPAPPEPSAAVPLAAPEPKGLVEPAGAELAAAPLSAPAPSTQPRAAASPAPDPATGQLRRLQRELEAAKAAAAAPPRRRRLPAALAALLALLVGGALGRATAPEAASPVELTLVAPNRPAELLAPRIAPEHPPPSAEDLKYAKNLLSLARDQLREGNLKGAGESLALCVDVAELPACHRLRGTLFSLRGQHAEAHRAFSRFLELAPSAPGAEEIRSILDP